MSAPLDGDGRVFKKSNWPRHFGLFAILAVILNGLGFALGSMLENNTVQMLPLFLAEFFLFSLLAGFMVYTYRSYKRLNFGEKLLMLISLFTIFCITGIILHNFYFSVYLGQKPTVAQMLDKAMDIVKYNSICLLGAVPVVWFTKSRIPTSGQSRPSQHLLGQGSVH